MYSWHVLFISSNKSFCCLNLLKLMNGSNYKPAILSWVWRKNAHEWNQNSQPWELSWPKIKKTRILTEFILSFSFPFTGYLHTGHSCTILSANREWLLWKPVCMSFLKTTSNKRDMNFPQGFSHLQHHAATIHHGIDIWNNYCISSRILWITILMSFC